jgi:hypothetical protein
MPTPIVDVASTIGDTNQTVTTHTGGVALTSDFPAPAAGTGPGADSASSISAPNFTSPNYPHDGGASPATPVATTTSTEAVATHTTKFL